MTKCSKDEANLKSTAYNQTGQNIFEQLSAYNSMSSHLRRVLLAKSVVDARNKSYVSRRKQTCNPVDCKSRFLKRVLSDDLIDRLAYDTLHHPADALKMNFNSKCSSHREHEKRFVDCYDDYDVTCPGSRMHDQNCYEESNRASCRSRPTSRTNKSLSLIPSSRQTKHRDPFVDSSTSRGKKIKSANANTALRNQDHFLEQRYEEDSSRGESISDFLVHERNHLSGLSSSSRSYEDSEPVQKREKTAQGKDEEAKYADFVYEITREIMHNGLYTDQELQDVFEKHLEKNRETLDMSKMLYEIYQLKMSLNVSDDSDDDELEDIIHTQQLLSVPQIRPPTPPKVLNENKVIEKLMSYQKIIDVKRRSTTSGAKSVLLIDANPELLVTERDVLMSLMEVNIDPQQAQKICKSLFHKSKDTFLADTVQVGAERAHHERRATGDIQPDSNAESSNDSLEIQEQEKSCTTSDLILKEDKNVQALE